MKIFQTIPTNSFFSNRIVSNIACAPSISIQNYFYGYSNFSAPLFPSQVVSKPFFYPQTFSYQSTFPTLNSHPPITNYHSNNHFGQFHSSPIPQNSYSISQILHYPTLHRIPTILTSYPVNQTLSARMPYEYHPQQIASINHLKKFSEIGTQTEPQNFIDIINSETQGRKGILRSRVPPNNPQQAQIHAFTVIDDLQEIKSELPPLPIVAKALRALNSDPRIGKVDCNQIKLSGLPQEMRYC